MADDLQARVKKLEAEVAALSTENAVLREQHETEDAATSQRDRALADGREQQTALAEVPRVIASSVEELDAALTALSRRAGQLLDGQHGVIHQVVDGRMRRLRAPHVDGTDLGSRDGRRA